MLDCVLISRDDAFRRQILELTRESDGPARLVLDLDENADEIHRDAVGTILKTDPHVVFVDLGESSTTGVRVLEALSEDAPDIGLIAAGPQLEAEALLEVIRAGASEYLPRPLGANDVATAFGRVRRRIVPSGPVDEPGSRGRLITVFSAKGGTGVTVTAANLAIALHEMTRKSTLLLDLTPAMGTASLVMGLQARYSYLDVIRNFHRIDEELLRSFLEMHETGVAVLSSPPAAGGTEDVPTNDQILGLIRLCRRHFAYVVVDGGSTLKGPVSSAITESDDRLLLTTPELPTLRNQKRALESLQPLRTNGKPPARIILTQYEEGMGVSPREVEEALGQAVFETLARDTETVIRSMNLGRPAVLAGRSRFARGLNRLADELAGPDRVDDGSSGLLGTLMRPFRSSK